MDHKEAGATPTSGVRLHSAGMRSTLPRRAVLDLVLATSEHRTAEEVRSALTEQGIDLPRSSVNNILGRLAGAGLIMRVDTLPGAARFERDTSTHDHFWCITCRSAFNVPAQPIDTPRVEGRIAATAVTHLGECTSCCAV
jgi:Fe2+ or Zn2+ uptake regulation protein